MSSQSNARLRIDCEQRIESCHCGNGKKWFEWFRYANILIGGKRTSVQVACERLEKFVRPQPLIAVTDVEASSRWYQQLLGCSSDHGGPAYERLVSNGELVLQLHRFETDHDHGVIGDVNDRPYGNGVLLWFEVDHFDQAHERSIAMGARIVLPKHRNPPPPQEGGPNHWEIWLSDPDGYVVVLSSPDGSGESQWKPS